MRDAYPGLCLFSSDQRRRMRLPKSLIAGPGGSLQGPGGEVRAAEGCADCGQQTFLAYGCTRLCVPCIRCRAVVEGNRENA